MRILCLDIGSKRIGVATSDPLGLAAHALTVIIRRGDDRDIHEIARICKDSDVKRLIIGIPLDQDGKEGREALKVKKFAERIEKYLKAADLEIPIEFWDERYSTRTAEENLINADVSRAKRRKVIDKMAAQVILEDYMIANVAGEEP